MIEDILPLSRVRVDILTELICRNLMAKELSEKIGRSIQSTYNALISMNNILEKEQNIYSIKSEVRVLLENFLIRNLLEKRLGMKKYYIFSYIKKYLVPKEMIFFGSYYRGTQTKRSDIDIYIISDVEDNLVKEVQDKLSRVIKTNVQIIAVKSKIHLTPKDKFSDLYKSVSRDTKMGLKIPLNILEG